MPVALAVTHSDPQATFAAATMSSFRDAPWRHQRSRSPTPDRPLLPGLAAKKRPKRVAAPKTPPSPGSHRPTTPPRRPTPPAGPPPGVCPITPGPDGVPIDEHGVPIEENYGVPIDGNYGVPINENYGVEPIDENYGVPIVENYGVEPNVDENYGVPIVDENYGEPIVEENYGVPTSEENYGVPISEENYGVQPNREENYGVPKQNYGVEPSREENYGAHPAAASSSGPRRVPDYVQASLPRSGMKVKFAELIVTTLYGPSQGIRDGQTPEELAAYFATGGEIKDHVRNAMRRHGNC